MINITFYGECLINNTSRVCFPPLSRPEPPPLMHDSSSAHTRVMAYNTRMMSYYIIYVCNCAYNRSSHLLDFKWI